jgi:hypothetical protein
MFVLLLGVAFGGLVSLIAGPWVAVWAGVFGASIFFAYYIGYGLADRRVDDEQ